jgi:hypothetical protein
MQTINHKHNHLEVNDNNTILLWRKPRKEQLVVVGECEGVM